MISFRHALLLALLLGAPTGCGRFAERPVDVDVGGHRLHLLLAGEVRRLPAVILESGMGGGIGWDEVRSQIARKTQVVAYERAGTGQSEPGPEPRDAKTIASELHTALHRAGIPPPYVLAGQSIGGIYVQVFAAAYPDETAALVLVDPTHASADLCLSFDEVKAWFMIHRPDDWLRVAAACGVAPEGLQGFLACKYRLMEAFLESVPEPRRSSMRSDWWDMIDKLGVKSAPWEVARGARAEAKVMADSIRQAIAARPLPKGPVILLAGAKMDLDALPGDALSPNVLALQAEARRWNLSAFQDWADATPGAKLEVVQGSGHDIEGERPQAVIDAIREVLRQLE